MAVHRDALDGLPAAPGEIPTTLWNLAQSKKRLGGLVVAGHWREVGTPADYLEVILDRLAGTKIIDRSADVGDEASIENSYVGHDAVIGEGAVVEDSVVAEGAVIGDKARVRRSLLFGAVRVGRGECVSDSVQAEPAPD